MKKILFFCYTLVVATLVVAQPSGSTLLTKIDNNMSAKTRIMTASMEINSRRSTRTMEMKIWGEGDAKSFTEYLLPAREKGTKMLKMENQLWIYSPSTDRTIKISGHMLRQSVMGSDLSYEDMMDDGKRRENYTAMVIGSEIIDGHNCWVLTLKSKTDKVTYASQKMWVDKQNFVPIQIHLFTKSGKLLKEIKLSKIEKFGDRWYPTEVVYKNKLSKTKGTKFIIKDIHFNVEISPNIFNKSNLR